MVVGLLIFYRASYQLPLSAVGLALFGTLALLRPDLALLYVPLTVVLFFMPKGIWDERFGIRPEGVRLPLHEVVLLVTGGAWVVRILLSLFRRLAFSSPRRSVAPSPRFLVASSQRFLRSHLPVLLFLLAGTLGVLIVPPDGRGEALREWRWLIIEPLIFYGLLRWFQQPPASGAARATSGNAPPQTSNPLLTLTFAPRGPRFAACVLSAFVVGGAFVGLVGVLQFAGLNLAPLIGDKVGFSDDRIFVEGVRRVSSVYGHPNNLGLAMGRVWPLAAALALAAWGREYRSRQWGLALFYAVCGVLAVGGLLVSFSKGALPAAVAAAVVLVVLHRQSMQRGGNTNARLAGIPWWVWLLAGGGAGVLLLVGAALLGIERFNPFGETSLVRLKTWHSALLMVRNHPLLGIGLDQFLALYPRYIDPSLASTSEQFTSHPHNLLLDVWLRMGVVGVVAFGWLLVAFYRRVVACAAGGGQWGEVCTGLAAAMAAALLHGLVDQFYFAPDVAIFFWLTIGVGDDC
jgi:hypothetical protein